MCVSEVSEDILGILCTVIMYLESLTCKYPKMMQYMSWMIVRMVGVVRFGSAYVKIF